MPKDRSVLRTCYNQFDTDDKVDNIIIYFVINVVYPGIGLSKTSSLNFHYFVLVRL